MHVCINMYVCAIGYCVRVLLKHELNGEKKEGLWRIDMYVHKLHR